MERPDFLQTRCSGASRSNRLSVPFRREIQHLLAADPASLSALESKYKTAITKQSTAGSHLYTYVHADQFVERMVSLNLYLQVALVLTYERFRERYLRRPMWPYMRKKDSFAGAPSHLPRNLDQRKLEYHSRAPRIGFDLRETRLEQGMWLATKSIVLLVRPKMSRLCRSTPQEIRC
jgi:hypothetical protein